MTKFQETTKKAVTDFLKQFNYEPNFEFFEKDVDVDGIVGIDYEVGLYHVYTYSYNSGVRYYPDGSGLPPSIDIVDLSTHDDFEEALHALLTEYMRISLDVFFEARADERMHEQMNEDEQLWVGKVLNDKRSSKMYNKITYGFVIQTYEGIQCISQEFIAGDQVEYENVFGNAVDVNVSEEKYQPFDMVQPDHDKGLEN